MRVTTILTTTAFISQAFAFPWLSPDASAQGHAEAMKRGLKAIAADENLVREIRDLYTEQKREAAAWEAAGKRSPVEHLLAKRAIDIIVGDTAGTVAGVVDSLAQSVEGSKRFPEPDYPYQAPGATDQRGPCPGLNTLANHGYLPRNGIVTAGQVIKATAQLFNMGADLAAVLVAGAVALNGDITTLRFSIGGADARTNSLGVLGGILGTETGLDGHGRVNEGDASATRCDFYLCNGDNHNMQPPLFKQMLDSAQQHGGGQFTPTAQAYHFHNRYQNSVSTNPNFYFIPPSALIVIGATYFHSGFFTNGTIGAGGVANVASIASFNGAHWKDKDTIVYVPERIPPQGWYRRAVPMFLSEALAGILYLYATPSPVPFGGNAGSTSKFVPGPGLLPTNAQDVDGLGCFLYNFLYADFFGEFQNILFTVESAVNAITGLLDPALSNFIGCTPNYPDETSPNKYGNASNVLKSVDSLPGAPNKQACLLLGASSQCIKDTNSYDSTTAVPNRWEFTSFNDGADNFRPS